MADARNYTAVGCVEPVCQGKSFSSTDAALFNVPIMLELALNEGRRFGSFFRIGRKTKPVSGMTSMADVREAFETQLNFFVSRLIGDLHLVEKANHREHPTPLSSALIEGCLKSGRCSTGGGAVYNFSGIQCVGPADTGDALSAIDRAVFRDRRMNLPGLVKLLKMNIPDEKWLLYLRGLEKFGNDEPEADGWTRYVIAAFDAALGGYMNARGGAVCYRPLLSHGPSVFWGNNRRPAPRTPPGRTFRLRDCTGERHGSKRSDGPPELGQQHRFHPDRQRDQPQSPV
jgi:formate C-acetyltransferase